MDPGQEAILVAHEADLGELLHLGGELTAKQLRLDRVRNRPV